MRAIAIAVGTVVAVASLPSGAMGGQPEAAEALDFPGGASTQLAVKAAYLYKLAPFVTWPANPAAPAAPLAICVQGADPFGRLLDRVVAGQTVAGRPIVVRRVPRLEPDQGCAIAYVAGSAAQSQAQALAAVEKAPVLTVTDAARGQAKGMVHLMLDGGKVRFAIDVARAEGAGIEISSKLLALAVVVKQ